MAVDRKNLLIGGLALALVGALGTCTMLYKVARENYVEAIQVRLNPIVTDRFVAKTGSQTGVMLLGDSRIEMWPEFKTGSERAINHGISGETTGQILGRLDSELRLFRPRVVVIQAGINDLKAIGVLPDKKGEIIADTENHLNQMIAKITSAGSSVIVTTIFPLGRVPLQRRPVWNGDIEMARVDVNRYLLGLKQPGVVVVDADSILAGKDGQIQPDYSLDTLHLNPAGYAALQPEMDRLLQSR